jgi:hypothetical protein
MWTEEEKKVLPAKYNCQLLYSSATMEQAKDRSLPKDAYLVFYKNSEEEMVMDVCRSSKKVNLFDLYYDKFRNVQKITFGYGNANPKLWGEQPKKKKRVS